MSVGPILPQDVVFSDLWNWIWSSRFESRASEIRKGATFTGDPVVDRGLILDGANDYVKYPFVNKFDDASLWSCDIIFRPDFAYDEDATRKFFEVYNGSTEHYGLVKKNNASNNVLTLILGGTTIADIASATYSSVWDVGHRNVLTIAGTTGDTDAWLNGTQILTADSTSWSPVNGDLHDLWVGADSSGTSKFDGKFDMVAFYDSLLTVDDHNALYAAVELFP